MRCPFYARAWLVQCEQDEGHDGLCVSVGDEFHGGWRPSQATLERCAQLDDELEQAHPSTSKGAR